METLIDIGILLVSFLIAELFVISFPFRNSEIIFLFLTALFFLVGLFLFYTFFY